MTALASVLELSFLGIVAFAVLWRYSDLPEIDWSHITMGALFFLSARAIGVWAGVLSGDPTAGAYLGDFFAAASGALDVIGGALVVEGALMNAYEIFEE